MIDAKRALRGAVLALWAGFFGWLWVTGELTRYLGPRTYWVVLFGWVALTLAALGHLIGLRDRRTIASRADVVGVCLLLLPMAVVIVIPDAQLGAQAASRKSSGGGFAAAVLLPVPDPEGEISFREIDYASESADYAASLGVADGVEVDLVGFVTRPDDAGGDFSVTRFYVSCCAADAIPYSVPVSGTVAEPEDTWVRVRGTLGEVDGRFLVEAERIDPIEIPDDPYLY